MNLRAYRSSDATATRAVFERAVRTTAAQDYTPAQIEAWAPTGIDGPGLTAWDERRRLADTVLAIDHDAVIGFSDLVRGELLDMLYVDPSAGRQGVGSALITAIAARARDRGALALETRASLTARPLFEHHGFVTVAQHAPIIDGVAMTNFEMRLQL